LTQYWRVTDGQTDRRTDGSAVASTALAMRALRRAVKTKARFGRLIAPTTSGLETEWASSGGKAWKVTK